MAKKSKDKSSIKAVVIMHLDGLVWHCKQLFHKSSRIFKAYIGSRNKHSNKYNEYDKEILFI